MGAYQWKYRLDELPSPPLVKRDQYERVKRAIEELQRYCITSIKCDDNTVTVKVDKGEALISAGGSGAAEGFTGSVEVGQVATYSTTTHKLEQKPVVFQIKNSQVLSATVGAEQLINTADAET